MNAVIYCRVSSQEQLKGTSLDSQLDACREYAAHQGMSVHRVFMEEGESAKVTERTQLLELLAHCKDRSNHIEVMVVWKVDRFARVVEDYFSLKAILKKAGVRIASVTEPVEDDPTGKLMETILAGFAQFDNDMRSVRTLQGLKARLSSGIFPWKPPLGYLSPGVGNKSIPDRIDPQKFGVIQRAWRLFLLGGYSKADIRRMLDGWGLRTKHNRPMTDNQVDRMFRNPYYAGVVRDPWSGAELVGKHVAMITSGEFARTQELMQPKSRRRRHLRENPDFPVRGIVRCPSCNGVMTAGWSRGKYKKYAYYWCYTRGCLSRRHGRRAMEVHDEFQTAVDSSSVPSELVRSVLANVICEDKARLKEMKDTAARFRQAELARENELQELIGMRAAKLVSDDEFLAQRDRLRRRITNTRVSQFKVSRKPLSEQEAERLLQAIPDLLTVWHRIPLAAKRQFGQVLYPAGYRFGSVRTSEKGLLFKALAPSQAVDSHSGGLTGDGLNTLIAEIRKFLAIIAPPEVPDKQAV